MKNDEITWKELRKSLNITPEEEEEIRVEGEIIEAIVEARKNSKLTQRGLSEKTGIKQPSIAKIEKGISSPTLPTILKLLLPIGYTIKIVPIDKKKNI